MIGVFRSGDSVGIVLAAGMALVSSRLVPGHLAAGSRDNPPGLTLDDASSGGAEKYHALLG